MAQKSQSKKEEEKEKKQLGSLSFKLDYDFQKGQVRLVFFCCIMCKLICRDSSETRLVSCHMFSHG